MLTAGHKEQAQENNLTFNSTTVKTGARCLSRKYKSPFFTLLPKGRKSASIKSPSLRQFYPFEQDTRGSQCVGIYLSHTSLLHTELLFIINHTCVRCYDVRTARMLIRQSLRSLSQEALFKTGKKKKGTTED